METRCDKKALTINDETEAGDPEGLLRGAYVLMHFPFS